MKHLLLAAGLLLALGVQAQGWPRSQQTGKVEFNGILFWPKQAKTEQQRQVLVRRWYAMKLTDDAPKKALHEAQEEQAGVLLTYAHVLKDAVIQHGKNSACELLGYSIELTPTAQGLRYSLTDFTWTTCKAVETRKPSVPLEQLLKQDSIANQATLIFFRQRFDELASW